jgi:hypothetical protein
MIAYVCIHDYLHDGSALIILILRIRIALTSYTETVLMFIEVLPIMFEE